MGFLKKITRPISRVLDKIVPNEIKPALPFLAAAAPFMAPGLMSLGGNTMLSRALISGGLNLGSQLAQEGSEGDFDALSLAMASGIGALSAPGTQPTTVRGDLRVPSSIGPGNAVAGSIDPGIATETIRTTTLPGFGAERVVSAGTPSAGDYLRGLSDSGGIGDKGLEFLAKGSDKLIGLSEGLAADGIFSKAGAKALSIPFTQGTMDLAVAENRRFNKQQIIDDALGALDDAADDAARASAIRLAMQQYGFTEDEITETIASAGYRAGGRVGFQGGGMDAGQMYITEPGIMGNPAVMEKIENMREFMIANPDIEDITDYSEKYESKDPDFEGIEGAIEEVNEKNTREFQNKYIQAAIKLASDKNIGIGDAMMITSDEDFDIDNMKYKGSSKGILEILNQKAYGGRVGAEEGGLMNLGGREMDMRGGGFIPIGKKERADDVPARLSKNEFVMTADAVRAAGGGSVNKGAKRMYDLMNNLEARV